MTEDQMVGWHHQLNVHEFEQAPGYGEGWGLKESDTTEQQQHGRKLGCTKFSKWKFKFCPYCVILGY